MALVSVSVSLILRDSGSYFVGQVLRTEQDEECKGLNIEHGIYCTFFT